MGTEAFSGSEEVLSRRSDLVEVRESRAWRRKRVMPDTMVAVKNEKKALRGEELGAPSESRGPEDKTEMISEGVSTA